MDEMDEMDKMDEVDEVDEVDEMDKMDKMDEMDKETLLGAARGRFRPRDEVPSLWATARNLLLRGMAAAGHSLEIGLTLPGWPASSLRIPPARFRSIGDFFARGDVAWITV